MERTVFGLIGRKLGHSDSAIIHDRFGLKDYRLFEIEPEEIEGFLNRGDLRAINVTIPYKKDVIPFLDAISDEARAVGGVNTIVFEDDGRKLGYNTDVYGLMYMTKRAGIDVKGKKVLVFGSGGASGAAKCAMEQLGAGEILIISRTGKWNYENLYLHEDADVLINATPVGMYPNADGSVVDVTRFSRASGAIDLVYNPRLTDFLCGAKKMGIPCTNGLPMLVAQAKKAEEFFLKTAIADAEIERVLGEVARKRTTICLIGMPGSGKSSVGERLSEISGLRVLDADAEIVKDAGMSIPEIMEKEGVPSFREREARVIDKLSLTRGAILVTGGGAILREDNRHALRRNARVYQLSRDVSLLPTDGRPLSQGADLRKMEKERAPYYEMARDVRIENDGTIDEAANKIWRDFCENTRD